MNQGAVTLYAYAALALHFVLGLAFNLVLPRHRAILATLLTGFLFLPSIEVDLAGILEWNRRTAPIVTVWIGILLYDLDKLARFRWRVWDLPILLWCLSAGASALSNGFTLYDATSGVFYRSIMWLGPYLIGRLYFGEREHLADLAKAAAMGAVVYIPFCLWEIVFGPQFHERLYGFQQHLFIQSIRGSLFRPLVFLQHGLMTTMWMATGALCAWALYWRDRRARLFGLPILPFAVAVTLTVLVSQSAGTTLLFLTALAVLWLTRAIGVRTPLVFLALVPSLWVGMRYSDVLPTSSLKELTSQFSESRANSFTYRLETEERLMLHAARRPLFGWSAWERDRTLTVDYEDKTIVVDGLWIIALSQNGGFGVFALIMMHLTPLLVLIRRGPRLAPRIEDARLLLTLAAVVGITMMDHLVNSMIMPYAILLLGALPDLARSIALTEGKASGPMAPSAEVREPPLPAGSEPRVLGS